MKRLANALAFAVVVLAVFAMEARSAWPQYSPGQLVACFAQRLHVPQNLRGDELPTLARFEGLPAVPSVPAVPRIDEAKLERAIERAQVARERMVQAEMRRVAERVNVQIQRSAGCKVVKIDQ